MEPSTTYLKYREMIQQGWFFSKELSWIYELFKEFENLGLISDAERRALFELAKNHEKSDPSRVQSAGPENLDNLRSGRQAQA